MKNRKFNIVDFLLLCLAIVVVIGGYLYFSKDAGETIFIGKQKVVFVAEADEINEDISNSIQIGDKLVAMGNYQDGEIIDVQIYDSEEIAAVDGKIVAYPVEDTKRIVVTIEANVNQYGPYIEFGGQEVKVGAPYWIKTDHMHAYGFVVDVLINE